MKTDSKPTPKKQQLQFGAFEKASAVLLVTHKYKSEKGNDVLYCRKLFVTDTETRKGAVFGAFYKVIVLNNWKVFNVDDVIDVKGNLIVSLKEWKDDKYISKTIIADLNKKYDKAITVKPNSEMEVLIDVYKQDNPVEKEVEDVTGNPE